MERIDQSKAQSQQQLFGDTQIHGNDNIFNAIQATAITLTQNKIIQVSVDEIKTRPFVINSPYKGLKSFEPVDKNQFFGRDQFIAGLINELEQTNIILLLGGSGSGKSSVVRAGLVPWLSQRWGARLVNLTLTPDQDPFESFYGSLLAYFKQSRAKLARAGQSDTLTQLARRLKQPDSFWFIFIDQFEELFTLSDPEKRDRFIISLTQLCQDFATDGSIKIVATMRADFLDQLDNEPANYLARLTQSHRPLMTRMHPDELRLAIEQPAAQHGVVFEQGLVETIIKDVQGQAGYLPLLQYTLDQLWESEVSDGGIHDRTLNIQSYRLLGGVRGALQKQVTQIYQGLSPSKQQAAQRIFLKLVGIGGDRATDTDWRPVRKRELRSRFTSPLEQTVLTQLVDANLLVSDTSTTSSKATIEIAHEILLTSWDKLREWIEQNREAIALRNRINEDASRWQTEKLDDELWSGTKLAQAVDLQKDRTFNQVLGGFNPEAAQFIRASAGLSERQAQEKEAQRQRELEHQKKQLAQEKKARKLAQRITVGAAIGGLIMTGLALLAGIKVRQSAIQQIETSIALSNAHLLNGQELEADIESIRAAKALKTPLRQAIVPDHLKKSVAAQLQQTAASGHEQNQSRSDEDELYDVYISLDNSTVAVQEGFRSIRLLEIDGSQIASITSKESSGFFPEQLSPDGTRLVTREFEPGTEIERIRLWDSKGGTELAVLYGGAYEHVKFSPDSTRLMTVGDETLYIWDSNGKEIDTIKGYQQIKPSPDNTSIAALSKGGAIQLWNFEGEKIASLPVNQQKAIRYKFSPDGTRLAIFRENNTIDLWDFSNNEVTTLEDSQKVVFEDTRTTFNPESTRLAAAGKDGTVLLWDSKGTKIDTLDAHQGEITTLEFSPSGDRFITIGYDKEQPTMRLWNDSGDKITTIETDTLLAFKSFSPDGTRFITDGEDDTVDLWDADGNWIASFEDIRRHELEFSPDGSERIFTNGEDGSVRLWDFSGRQIAILGRHQSEVIDMVLTSDGTQLVTSGFDGTARFWAVNRNAFPEVEGAERIKASPDGARVAIQEEDNTLYIWDFEKMESIRLEDSPFEKMKDSQNEDSPSVWDFVFSPDSSYLAAIEEEGLVYVWDTDGNKIMTIENPQEKGRFQKLKFSADGTQIAIVTESESTEANPDSPMSVRLWDIKDKKEVASFNDVPAGRVNDMVISPDRVKLAIYGSLTGEDRIAQIWDSADGKTITLEGHRGSVNMLQFVLEGTRVITNGVDDSTARLWDTKGNELAVFEGHEGDIYDVEFSPDGRRVATAGSDRTMRLWDIKGNELYTFEGHEKTVGKVKFSPDGTQLATGGYDGTVRLWDFEGNELARLGGNQDASVWNIKFSSDGNWLTIHREDKTVHRWHLEEADDVLSRQCDWVRDYLKNSNAVAEADRTLCDGVAPLSTATTIG